MSSTAPRGNAFPKENLVVHKQEFHTPVPSDARVQLSLFRPVSARLNCVASSGTYTISVVPPPRRELIVSCAPISAHAFLHERKPKVVSGRTCAWRKTNAYRLRESRGSRPPTRSTIFRPAGMRMSLDIR